MVLSLFEITKKAARTSAATPLFVRAWPAGPVRYPGWTDPSRVPPALRLDGGIDDRQILLKHFERLRREPVVSPVDGCLQQLRRVDVLADGGIQRLVRARSGRPADRPCRCGLDHRRGGRGRNRRASSIRSARRRRRSARPQRVRSRAPAAWAPSPVLAVAALPCRSILAAMRGYRSRSGLDLAGADSQRSRRRSASTPARFGGSWRIRSGGVRHAAVRPVSDLRRRTHRSAFRSLGNS